MARFAWPISIALIVCTLFYGLSQLEIERERQQGFIATACINAGGKFYVSWSNKPVCERP